MATTINITKKTQSPFVVELAVRAGEVDPVANTVALQVEDAGKLTVYTGNTLDSYWDTVTITGSGLNAALKDVAAGATYVTDPNLNHGRWTGATIDVVSETTTMAFSAITVRGSIYGGALALNAKGKITTQYIPGVTATVNNTQVILQNTNAKAVYGGGGGYGSTVEGDTAIRYAGGNISSIYGGGYTGSVVEGDVAIDINGSTTGRIGKIYAGGYNSVVKGNATVTFTNNSGSYNNLTVGSVSGAGYGKVSRVEGSSTLVFNNYSGKFTASIADFDVVQIAGKSSITLTKAQNKNMTGATYEFVITDDTLGLQGAMLTWNSKVVYSNIIVSVETADAFDVTLIQSQKLKLATDFNVNSIKVMNADGEILSSSAYQLFYDYDRKAGGSVSIQYRGLNLVFDGNELQKIVLSGADDEVNVVAGGKLAAGLNTAGGNDTIRLQSGSEVNGGIQAGTGDDALYIQKDALLTGEVVMGDGNDQVFIEDSATVTSNIALGSGVNALTVQKDASMTGTIIFASDSTNTVTVNGAVMGFSGGDATTNNTIILSGDAVHGGGIGYWTKMDVYDYAGGHWTKLKVFVVRDLNLTNANDTVIVGNNAFVNNISLGGGDDKLTINQGAGIGYDYVSTTDWQTRGNVIPATINLGTGHDVLVLNSQLGTNVNVITEDDGGDVIVLGADMTVLDNQLLVGSTNNVLVVANGRQVSFADMTSLGNFLSGNGKYDAIYLSMNAIISAGDEVMIQNYTGSLSREVILVSGAPTEIPAAILPYYTPGNGVVNSKLFAEVVDMERNAKITSSEVTAEEIYVHGGNTIDNSASGFVSVGDYILVSNNASVRGAFYLGYEPIHELSSDATADIAGSVDAIQGGSGNEQVNVSSSTASIGAIDLGAGDNDTVNFSAGTFADAELVIANTEWINLADGADVTVGSAAGYIDVLPGLNSKFTEVVNRMITVGDWDKNISFTDGYTIRLNGRIDADATLTNNTVLLTANANYFTANIYLNGANTFSVQDGVQDWYDYQQFKFSPGATLGFKLGTGSFFALDGFVNTNPADIVAVTEFGQNSGLGLADWVYIQDWNHAFSIADFQNIFGNAAHAPSLVFENLNVIAGAEIYGYILMDDMANQVVINDGAVINGDTAEYDYAAIMTEGGNDIVTIGAATINGRLLTDDGDDTVTLNGSTINTAINQGIPAVELGDGNDTIALNGATVNGGIAFGPGDDLLTSTGISNVNSIIFGSNDNEIDVLGGTLTAVNIGFDGVAANNTIAVETGATFNIESVLELAAIGTNTVLVDGGELGVAGVAILEGNENQVTLANGGHIAGLQLLSMEGPTNTLELADDATAQTAEVIAMDGVINQVNNAGALTVADTLFMGADDQNQIDNIGAFNANSVLMAEASDEIMTLPANINTIVNAGTFNVTDTLEMAGDTALIDNRGAFSVDTLVANGGSAVGNAGYQIDGGAQALILNNADATLTAASAIKLYSANNALQNGGTVAAGGASLLMAGSEELITGVSFTENAANSNSIVNTGSGNLEIGDVAMYGTENLIINQGAMTTGNIIMAGNVEIDLAGQTVASDAATLNIIDLSMGGQPITAALAAGDIAMVGERNALLAMTDFTPIITAEVAEAQEGETVQIGAVGQTIQAADITMIGEDNTVDFSMNAALDQQSDVKLKAVQIGAVTQSLTAASLEMNGINNLVRFGVGAEANGLYDVDNHHLESRLELGPINQTLNAPVTLNGFGNTLDLGINLTSTEEGNLATSGIAVNAVGDIAMTGDFNTLNGFVNLTSGTQSVLDVNGNVLIGIDGNITMDAAGANTFRFGATLTETPAALPGESGGVINLNNGATVKVAVDGDITMIGTGATNELYIGENAFYTGNVMMGTVYGDDLSARNILVVEEIGNIQFTSLAMTAVENNVILNGNGAIGTVNGIRGGVNDFTIGKGVTVNSPIVFQDIIDADLIGTEGYTILANAANSVALYGTAFGIDSGATNADDTFRVIGGLVSGDIVTGSSANGDLVEIGGVSQQAYDDGLINARNASSVTGNVTMGTATSAGTNILNIISTVVTDGAGQEIGLPATVGGNVTMTSTNANTLNVIGAASTPDADGKVTIYEAAIGGNVTMTGSSNFATLAMGTIDGTVTADATSTDNVFILSGFTVIGDMELDAEEQNLLNASNSNLAAVDMTAIIGNTLQLTGSAAETIAMTATDGFNTATVQNSTTGSITMDAALVNANAADINNTLNLFGQLIPAADPTQAAPTVVRTVVTGDVAMNAENANTLNIGAEDGGVASYANFGSATVTGALNLTGLTNTIAVWAGTEASYTDGPSAGTEVDMRALAGSVAMSGKTNVLGVNQGALGITAGGVALTNLDANGDVIADATNRISVADTAMLILDEAVGGERQAVTLGSASVNLGTITPSGYYGDAALTTVQRDADGYETYVYNWKDTTTPGVDTAAATTTNTVGISGKLYAGDLTMTGRTNIVSVAGPATQDPDQLPLGDYVFDVGTIDVDDVRMYGESNTIVTTSTIGYNASFKADSVTMGDIVVNYDTGKTVKILAHDNSLLTSSNTYVEIDGVSMTATISNRIDIAGYTRRTSADAPDLLATDGINKLVANPGDEGPANPFVKAVDDTTTNTLGDVVMNATGASDITGTVVTDGNNWLELGQNAAADDVTMTGYDNDVILESDSQAVYYLVNPTTGEAVKDALDQQLTETVTLQNAGSIGNLVFHLPSGMAGIDPANAVNMGSGSRIASITSTDTYTVGAMTAGAVDVVILGVRALVSGSVDLGYGNDIVTLNQDSEITGNLNFGPGADTLNVNGSATVGSIDFGTNLPDGDRLNLSTGAILTVNGDITFQGTLSVVGAIGAAIVLTGGAGLEAVGDDARLNFSNGAIVFGNVTSDRTFVTGTLGLGNGTFDGTMTFNGVGTLAILPFAEGATTFTIAESAEVLFADAGTWLYNAAIPVTFGQPTATDDLLRIFDDTTLMLDGLMNFGTGANQINLGKNATFEVNQAWSAGIAAVNAAGVPVDAAGKTEAEVPAGTFVPLTGSGTVAITMDHQSTLELNADASATAGITLLGYHVVAAGEDPEVIGTYTITGSGSIDANIGVSDAALAYKLNLGAGVGNVTFGSGADTLTITADSEAGVLAFGTGEDTLALSGNLTADGLTYGGTLTVNGSGEVDIEAVTISHALTTADTVSWKVDTFTVNNTTVTGKLVLTGGDNTLALTNATLGAIDFGSGNDELAGTGTVGAVSAADLTISGTITAGTNSITGSGIATLVEGLNLTASKASGFTNIVLDYTAGAASINLIDSNVSDWDELAELDNLDVIINSGDLAGGSNVNLITANENFTGTTAIDLTIHYGVDQSQTISLAWSAADNAYISATAVDGKLWKITGKDSATLNLAATVAP